MLPGFSKRNGYGGPWEHWVAVQLGAESLGQLWNNEERLDVVTWIRTGLTLEVSHWGELAGRVLPASVKRRTLCTKSQPAAEAKIPTIVFEEDLMFLNETKTAAF